MLTAHGLHMEEIFLQIKKTLQFVTKFDQISDYITPVNLIKTDHLY